MLMNVLTGRDNNKHDAYIIIDVCDERHVDIYTTGVDNGVVRYISIDELIEILQTMKNNLQSTKIKGEI